MKSHLQALWTCSCGIYGGVLTCMTKDPSLLSKVEYLLCYACAGSQFQMCAMRLGTPGAFRFHRPLSLVTVEDRLQIVLIAVQSYWIMKAQAEQLPVVLLPIGRTEITTFSKASKFWRAEEEHQVYTPCVEVCLCGEHRPLHTSGTYQKDAARVVHSTVVNKL
ncbi:hypothetical protein WJX79_006656 [Trebouxia sp. C0005]